MKLYTYIYKPDFNCQAFKNIKEDFHTVKIGIIQDEIKENFKYCVHGAQRVKCKKFNNFDDCEFESCEDDCSGMVNEQKLIFYLILGFQQFINENYKKFVQKQDYQFNWLKDKINANSNEDLAQASLKDLQDHKKDIQTEIFGISNRLSLMQNDFEQLTSRIDNIEKLLVKLSNKFLN